MNKRCEGTKLPGKGIAFGKRQEGSTEKTIRLSSFQQRLVFPHLKLSFLFALRELHVMFPGPSKDPGPADDGIQWGHGLTPLNIRSSS